MEDFGWIKLHRKILQWEWYDDIPTKVVFLHLILKANHEPHRWHGHNVERGQVIFSYNGMAKELGLTTQNVRTAIEHLKSTHEVTHTSPGNFSLVTVNNYNNYQVINTPTNTQLTHSQHTGNNTIKNEKNEKNERINTENNFFQKPDENLKVAATSQLLKFLKQLYPNNIATVKIENYMRYNKPEHILLALKNSSCVGEQGLITCLKHYKKSGGSV